MDRAVAAHRPAKEGVTAVAGAVSSAARRQPTPSGAGARVPQQSRNESADGAGRPADAAVALVAADTMTSGGSAPAGQRSSAGARRAGRRSAQPGGAAATAPGSAG